MTSILIADDHAVVREGVKQILAAEFAGAFFGEAARGPEVVAAVGERDWDLVLLDLNMPGRGGLDVLKEVKSLRPRLLVLVFSMYAESGFAIRALKLGAAGYITKDCIPEELARAVHAILGGGRYISVALAEKVAFDTAAGEGPKRSETLSDREYQVLRMIGSGKTTKEIAAELCLSVKTVSTYRSRILEKIGVTTTGDLIRYAIQNRLTD